MDNENLEYVLDEIRFEIRSIAGNSGYSYLNSSNYKWRDANGYVHKLEDMVERYLKNCIKEIENSYRFINISYETIKSSIDFDDDNFTEEEKGQIIAITKSCLRELMEEKKAELEEELKSR